MNWPGKIESLSARLDFLCDRRRVFGTAALIILIGELFKIPPFMGRMSADVWLYFHTAEGLVGGVQPYLDRPFGYPPYSLLWLVLPLAARTPHLYSVLFSCQMMVLDLLIQLLILGAGIRSERPRRGLSGLLVYVLSTLALRSVVLERFDLAPVAIMTAAVAAFLYQKPSLSGYLIILAAGTKAYPLLSLPILATAAWRRGALRTFSLGCLLGVLPLIVLGCFLPWWNFATAHSGRGLQVESLYASAIWFAHNVFGVEAIWSNRGQFFDVGGALADASRPVALALWLGICFGSLLLTCRAVARATPLTTDVLIRSATVPMMAFVAFGPVLSPQYLLWLVVPMSVCSSGIQGWPRLLFLFCCVLTPLVYPTESYATGIKTFQACALLLRNVLLCCLFFYLAKNLVATGHPAKTLSTGVKHGDEGLAPGGNFQTYGLKDTI